MESERLCIRLVAECDLSAVLKMNGDNEVTRFLPYPSWRSMEEAEKWFQRMSSLHASGEGFQFALVEKETGVTMGTCGLFHFDEGQAEIGYVLGRAYWGRGFMSEAMATVIGFAFGPLALRRLTAEVESPNLASTRMLLNLGFKKEGVMRERWIAKGGETTDAEIYGLLRNEWTAPVPR